MKSFTAKVGIYSNSTSLCSLLDNKFKEKSLKVTVFNTLNGIDYREFDYLIFDLLGNNKKIHELERILNAVTCKTIILFPRTVQVNEKEGYDDRLRNLLSLNNNVGAILVPELIGESVKFNENYISHNLIAQSILSERIKITSDAKLINLVSLKSLIEVIVKELFSFGISGQILSLGGYNRSQRGLLTNYLGVSEKNIVEGGAGPETNELNRTDFRKVTFSLRLALKNTKRTFLDNINRQMARKPERPNQTNFKFPKLPKLPKLPLKPFVYAALILLVPLLILLVSLILFFLSYKIARKDISISEKLITASIKTGTLSRSVSLGIPFYSKSSDLTVKSGQLFAETLELGRLSSEFLSRATSDQIYDVTYYTDTMSGVVEKIYTDSGFLQSDIANLNISKFTSNFTDYREKILSTKLFTSRLSSLVGSEKPMKYLVLFQNNMELRPTGGFIGSFALITLDKGKLSEIVVNDVYSADGQLKGHVDPPEPIREHLGEGGWFLRDSNWDPDFPESAKKVEWFLNKEIDETVDGVIAVDLSFVKKLLEITGPITLSDFDKTITTDNFYQNIQSEVEENFFPGSIKKASFLTSLVKELTVKLQDIPNDQYYPVFSGIYKSLNERHVQVYLHDLNAQKAMENLNFAGAVKNDITYSLIDANLGVNKANQYIRRSHDLTVGLSKKTLTHDLLVTYENVGSQQLGNASVYKTYTRLILPKGANVSGVRLYDPYGASEDLNFDTVELEDRKEIGFLINLLPKDIKKLKVVWTIDTTELPNAGEYNLFVRKQAGTDNDKLRVVIKARDLALTKGTGSVYTTDLNQDFQTKLILQTK